MTIEKTAPCWCGGECCSAVPLSDEEVQRILAATGGSFDDWFETTNAGTFTRSKTIPSDPDVIVYRCCFFDSDTRICTIYDLRPQICRDYDCHA